MMASMMTSMTFLSLLQMADWDGEDIDTWFG
jgi:hypothetical protein